MLPFIEIIIGRLGADKTGVIRRLSQWPRVFDKPEQSTVVLQEEVSK